ncbi:putative protein-signal peptide and transmembrane prediction [Cyclobacterium qasimii M12-11B]|uniref:DUF4886 domain-containing protein n=2 Tax=Cyclobacterium qasimii TaxID=1350429 RepID=S7VPD4_9BACT|nr:putative protein-signal peptide and transmembrane prediction [Cyclobacterium qasimii M12-11B]GEO22142.1 DUF4886 domain-containing protein [Cyclobacterium qasimii]
MKNLVALIIILFCSIKLEAGNSDQTRISNGDTVRLMLVGNSFSKNATAYLQQIASEQGKHLIIGRAELGGCSLERHWRLVEEAEGDSTQGAYKGKALRTLLLEEPWDFVSIQQNSMNSTNISTYRPYAHNMYEYIKELVPDAEVVIHQTWAYRADAIRFGNLKDTLHTSTEYEMWQASRRAYHTIAAELGVRMVPVGDGFWYAGQHPRYGYEKDETVSLSNYLHPELPKQDHSLHVGYQWNNEKVLRLDSNHANAYGCYLGSLIWYSFLFGENPTETTYQPDLADSAFIEHIRITAMEVVDVLPSF